jgi:hypothetical protein
MKKKHLPIEKSDFGQTLWEAGLNKWCQEHGFTNEKGEEHGRQDKIGVQPGVQSDK